MFMAGQGRQDRHTAARVAQGASGGKPDRFDTLKRRYDFHLGEAIRAGLQGSHDKAAGHSGQALLISRKLCADATDPALHAPELAAALCAHARYGGGAWQAIAMLTESAGHYAALAEANPAAYEVPRIDVLTRIALASDAAGNTGDAIGLLREVVGMYLKAPATDQEERDIGLARARFHLGRCLLASGQGADGLAETQAGLELAEDVLDRLAVVPRGDDTPDKPEMPAPEAGWLVAAPRYLQLAAPDWAAAAVRAMTLYAGEGQLARAATAARTAVLVSGGLAELGGDLLRDVHAAIAARAAAVTAEAGKHADGCVRAGKAAHAPVQSDLGVED
ncbi:MAG TPA: hypothetical protein VMI73_12115 [Trebonia sp.]|nr:hypothetical protein [Trebonia sp.]